MAEEKKKEFCVTTPIFRVNYPALAERKVWADSDPGKEPKFEVRADFPKVWEPWMEIACPGNAAQMALLRKTCAEAAKAFWGDKEVKGLWKPIRDGDTDEKAGEEEKGFFYAKLASQFAIACVDQKKNEFVDREAIRQAFYSGSWARAAIQVAAFETKGNRGITFYLQGIQKVKDGTRLTTTFSASNAFGAIAEVGGNDDVEF
jgi:hypothetical protein